MSVLRFVLFRFVSCRRADPDRVSVVCWRGTNAYRGVPLAHCRDQVRILSHPITGLRPVVALANALPCGAIPSL